MMTEMQRPYTLIPLPIVGCAVHGINLSTVVPANIIEMIKHDTARHRLLVFKDQPASISGVRHVVRVCVASSCKPCPTTIAQQEISKWFGELDSETFSKHPRSPCFDIFRVSNNPAEGCTGVGRTGWHIDGTFRRTPYSHALYHMVSVPKDGGPTSFIPLRELLEAQTSALQATWKRLWMCTRADREGHMHPMVHRHPETGDPALIFHLGMTHRFVWDADDPNTARMTTRGETEDLLDGIHQAITQTARHLIYHHVWERGDFIITDNLAVAHEASPQTQLPVERIGLRVLHRTTVKGTHMPVKLD